MIVKEKKNEQEISLFLENIIFNQSDYEQNLNAKDRKQNGVFLTNSLTTIDSLLDIIEIDATIFDKKILEPSCGQGIFILKLLDNLYSKFSDSLLISKFISNSIFFIDIDKKMIEQTKSNIKSLYYFLFEEEFEGTFNDLNEDFTKKIILTNSLFEEKQVGTFDNLYQNFDYVIGNPPYVSLYGRRDKKENEQQRIDYLKNYNQFPNSVKNGKINLVMLFIEHSLELLKEKGKLSFIIDISFFETAYQHTRKFLLENTLIQELQINIQDFEVASGQIIIKLSKEKPTTNLSNKVKIIDHQIQKEYFINQSDWYNSNDEYKFRYNNCKISKEIIQKIESKNDKTLLELYPKKNLRTCVMLLDMEDKFTFTEKNDKNISSDFIYPYYQGSKSLSEKYGKLEYKKYFHYNKPLQDKINDELKIELEKQGIKNKKRLGLGETIIYDNPKLFIRQSAKEIIATLDLEKSAANNSLYIFSLRNNSEKTIDFLYFLCGFLNSDLITYYAQQRNIIRFSKGKQPQIKIKDLGSIFIPVDTEFQTKISFLCKEIYLKGELQSELKKTIDTLIYEYYDVNEEEILKIEQAIKDF
ncbi:MAG: hypothetical protein COZ18_06875 [Flexibacter sp. CG_4_10_14_3_um_filter_32_15]|nr:MAG: hypothetical protein COZ18_06875 [Flexibacter sp. CG_4_10_14_3_um_filter_32_15]